MIPSEKEDFGPIRRLAELVKPYMEQLVAISFLMIIGTAFGMILPFAAGHVIDLALSTKEEFGALNQYIMYVIAALFVMAFINYISVYWVSRVGAIFLKDLRLRLYTKILSMPLSFFARNSSGDLNSRLGVSISIIQRVVTLQIPKAIQCVFRLNICIILLFFMQIKLTLAALLIVPFIALTASFFGKKVQLLSALEQDVLASASSNVEETINGIVTVQSFGREKHEEEKYASRHLEKLFSVQLRNANVISLFSSVVQFLVFSALVVVFWYGGVLIINNEITPGKLTTYVLYAVYMSASMIELGMHYTSLKELTGASRRVFEILDEQSDLKDAGVLSKSDVSSKAIEFQSVSFSYNPSDAEAISDISFSIHEGETVAFIGASGSGKSTLYKLLLRFYDPQKGSILIGGQDIKNFKLHELRSLFGLVAQDTQLFSGSVLENVTYGKSDGELLNVQAAIDSVGASDFVDALPNGINEFIGTGGTSLSGGQRQRLAIVRAYIKDPEIVLLDEATSALDAISEHKFQEGLTKLKANRTTLIIAHRMSTIQSADKIIIMDKGRIVEVGDHHSLIKTSEIYTRYCELQAVQSRTK